MIQFSTILNGIGEIMEINIEPNILTLRLLYKGTYKDRNKIDFICTLVPIENNTVILKAAMGRLTREALGEICNKLLELGFKTLKIERKGKWRIINLEDSQSTLKRIG